MIVGCARERDEDRWLPCCCDFRHSAGARSANDQIGAREGRRHVVNKFENLCGVMMRFVRGQRVIIVTFARLMDDSDTGRLTLQYRQAPDHSFVDGVRSLAAAKNQYSGSSAPLCRDLEKCTTHRNACHIRTAKVFPGFFEMDGGGRDKACDYSVGKSRNHVGFEGKRRNVLPHRTQHRWS